MISIAGRIAGIDKNSIPAYMDILVGSDSSNIGYRVYCTKKTIDSSTSTHLTLFTENIIREESNKLYGFKYIEEKQAFKLLLKAKGIGGNSALLILDNVDNVNDLYQAIKDKNIEYFVKFKGVGKATAESIVKLKIK